MRFDLILALDGFDLHGYSLLSFHACSYGMTQLPPLRFRLKLFPFYVTMLSYRLSVSRFRFLPKGFSMLHRGS